MDFDIIDSMLDAEYYIKIIIIILILLLNGILVLMYVKMKTSMKWTTPNIFLLNQAFADTTVCVPLMLHVLPRHMQRDIWQHAYPLLWYTVFVSLGSVLLNTFDRYISLKNPFHRLKLKTRMRVCIAILSVWLLSMIPAVGCSLTISSAIDHNWDVYWNAMTKVTITLFVLVLIIVMITIALLVLSARLLDRNTNSKEEESQAQTLSNANSMINEELMKNKERRMVKIMYAMVIVHAVTTFPWILAEILFSIYEHTAWVTFFVLLGVTYIIYTLSAVINPLLTLFLKQDYNRALPACFRRTGSSLGEIRESTISMNEVDGNVQY